MTAVAGPRRAARLAAVAFWLLAAFLLGGGLRLRYGRSWYTSRGGAAVRSWWMRRVVHAVGVRVRVEGRPVDGPCLMAANHVSWLDILAIAGVSPAGFVAKDDVRDWPLIGTLAAGAGTLFLPRRRSSVLGHTNRALSARLSAGCPMAVFPEGTTTDGLEVRHFHAALFQAAVDSGAPVQPVRLNYRRDGAVDTTAAFIGDDNFLSHLLRLTAADGIELTLHFLPPLAPDGYDRRTLAAAAYERVRSTGVPTDTRAVTSPVAASR